MTKVTGSGRQKERLQKNSRPSFFAGVNGNTMALSQCIAYSMYCCIFLYSASEMLTGHTAASVYSWGGHQSHLVHTVYLSMFSMNQYEDLDSPGEINHLTS